MNKDCDHTIGVYPNAKYIYDDFCSETFWVEQSKIAEFAKQRGITIKQACDWRNLTYQRFPFCPFCGTKVDWKKIRKDNENESNK